MKIYPGKYFPIYSPALNALIRRCDCVEPGDLLHIGFIVLLGRSISLALVLEEVVSDYPSVHDSLRHNRRPNVNLVFEPSYEGFELSLVRKPFPVASSVPPVLIAKFLKLRDEFSSGWTSPSFRRGVRRWLDHRRRPRIRYRLNKIPPRISGVSPKRFSTLVPILLYISSDPGYS